MEYVSEKKFDRLDLEVVKLQAIVKKQWETIKDLTDILAVIAKKCTK